MQKAHYLFSLFYKTKKKKSFVDIACIQIIHVNFQSIFHFVVYFLGLIT